jgi:hypothetical protein
LGSITCIRSQSRRLRLRWFAAVPVGSEGGASDSILYFRVDDICAAQAAVLSRGIEFTHAPHLIHAHADGTEEWMAFFKDNEGRALALMSQIAPQD